MIDNLLTDPLTQKKKAQPVHVFVTGGIDEVGIKANQLPVTMKAYQD
jgi:hypothetical protein